MQFVHENNDLRTIQMQSQYEINDTQITNTQHGFNDAHITELQPLHGINHNKMQLLMSSRCTPPQTSTYNTCPMYINETQMKQISPLSAPTYGLNTNFAHYSSDKENNIQYDNADIR